MNLGALLGLLVMVASEAATLARIEPFYSWNTPIAWTGYSRLKDLAGSGFLCGVLWELWNYWSGAKWHYTVPIMGNVKIFEMPLPGYVGFPAFALECFTMYVCLRALTIRLFPAAATHLRQPIALS